MIYIILLLFVFNYTTLPKTYIQNVGVNMQGYKLELLKNPLYLSNNINNSSMVIDIKYAAILIFVPILRVHDIVVFSDNGHVLTVDYTPINQSNPNVIMRLLIGKSVPAEVRIRKMATWNLEEWYGLPNISVSEIEDIDLRNKIIRVIDAWNQKNMDIVIDRGLEMNLYKRNCKHFSNFVIRNFFI